MSSQGIIYIVVLLIIITIIKLTKPKKNCIICNKEVDNETFKDTNGDVICLDCAKKIDNGRFI